MNYRHAFHAGNFADVHKHVILLALLQRMAAKPAPYLYIDTHAGRGLYSLSGGEAQRTGEWMHGIERVRQLRPSHPVIRQYLQITAPFLEESKYPGSPLIALHLLREDDRAVLVEQQDPEAQVLRASLTRTRYVSVQAGDGYAALKAHLPPKEKRCLVLIDPPFEDAREFELLQSAVTTAMARWPQAVIAVWYPIKAGLSIARWFNALQTAGLRKLLACELAVRDRTIATGLNGSGVLIANPPWQIEEELKALHVQLLSALREGGNVGDQRVDWIVGE